jgi:hypothetical protein
MDYHPSRHVRWIVLARDGRHTTLGCNTAPDAIEIAAAGSALASMGLTGWLVRLEGDYWARRTPVALTMVQPLAHAADADWPAAVAAFEAMRMAATSSKVRSSPSRMAG